MRRSLQFLLLLIVLCAGSAGHPAWAQRTGEISGTVRDRSTQEALVGVTVFLEGTQLGTASDESGRFRITGVPTGSYNLKATFVGYEPLTRFNLSVTSGNANIINLELSSSQQQLGEVRVEANRAIRVATPETPLSVQRLNVEEIKSNPGGNFDISRVVQVLPGVGGTAGSVGGFRNDIIIRGGAPNENVYYLDGVEVPVINHFSTQGSAGGPVGILNVSFIEDVTLSSSAFEARYDNALSSVLQFRQRDGNPNRVQGNVRLSATEVAGTLEGPLAKAKNTTFLASIRRSYLQLLFETLDLPIKPSYWDAQFKITHKLSPKTTLTALGVGALDDFSTRVPRNSSPEAEYTLRATPSFNQWNYTVGASLRHLLPQGFLNVALSRTQLYTKVDLFEDRQVGDETRRVLRTRSGEVENKLRADVNLTRGKWQLAYGVVGQYIEFDSNFRNRLRRELRDAATGAVVQPGVLVQFSSDISFARFGAFAQATRAVLPNDRLTLSGGIRADGNSFTDGGANLLRTLSPRVSASYALAPRWNLNASVGRYYKIPVSTVLGFRDAAGELVNRSNRYIGSTHYVSGLEWLPTAARRFTLEGFYKKYDHYPVSVRDGISLANLGGDFTALGNEAVTSTGRGRAYGVEFFFQQKLTNNLFAVASYTAFRSEFSGRNGQFRPSAWDTRHLVSGLLGRKFGRGWEVGVKYRFAGGAPFTPLDLEASRRNYLAIGTGVLDFAQLNTQRLPAFQQVDFRLDKKINLRRTTLDFFIDLQNAFAQKQSAYPQYTFQRTPDNQAFVSTDGGALQPDGSNAIPVILTNNDALVTPSFGFIVEF